MRRGEGRLRGGGGARGGGRRSRLGVLGGGRRGRKGAGGREGGQAEVELETFVHVNSSSIFFRYGLYLPYYKIGEDWTWNLEKQSSSIDLMSLSILAALSSNITHLPF